MVDEIAKAIVLSPQLARDAQQQAGEERVNEHEHDEDGGHG